MHAGFLIEGWGPWNPPPLTQYGDMTHPENVKISICIFSKLKICMVLYLFRKLWQLTCDPHFFSPRGHMESYTPNNVKMEFLYMEIYVFVALHLQERSYKDSIGQRQSAWEFYAKMKVNSCTIVRYMYVRKGRGREDEEIGSVGGFKDL